MNYENINFEITTELKYKDAYCPIHKKIILFQIEDGWFKTAFFCPKCKVPYTIGLVKMKKWNKEALKKALLK